MSNPPPPENTSESATSGENSSGAADPVDAQGSETPKETVESGEEVGGDPSGLPAAGRHWSDEQPERSTASDR